MNKTMEYFRDHPDQFVEKYMGLKLFPYQKRLLCLMTKAPLYLSLCKQVGKSWIDLFIIQKSHDDHP